MRIHIIIYIGVIICINLIMRIGIIIFIIIMKHIYMSYSLLPKQQAFFLLFLQFLCIKKELSSFYDVLCQNFKRIGVKYETVRTIFLRKSIILIISYPVNSNGKNF